MKPISECNLLCCCRRILVDTGEGGKADYIKNLKDTLENQKATLQNIIITHWHADHTGGISDVINNCPCGKLVGLKHSLKVLV
jgi:glyoxylase-like metal-dependent hydrolase (beta-lactamase superfamily II)